MAHAYIKLSIEVPQTVTTTPDPDPLSPVIAAAGSVLSFNGRSGVVVPTLNDYSASQVLNDSSVTGVYVDAALDWLDANKVELGAGALTANTVPITDSNGDLIDSLITESGGTLTIGYNVVVTGTSTLIDSTTVAVGDSLFKYAKDNTTTDLVDMGWYGVYGPTPNYAGMFRDATDGKFKLFTAHATEPTTTVAAGYTDATLVVGDLEISGTSIADAVLGRANLTTQYRLPYVNSAGTLTESTTLLTDASGNLSINGDITLLDSLQWNTSLTPPSHAEGTMYWDQDDNTLALMTEVSGTTIQVGQEVVLKATNKTGVTLNNGDVVYVNGAQGNRPTVALADADLAIAKQTIGVVTSASGIANNATGYVTLKGLVRGIDTSSFTEGDELFLSSTAGELTNSAPAYPARCVRVGYALNSTVNGHIAVAVHPKAYIDDITGLTITTPNSNDLLYYNGTSWVNGARSTLDLVLGNSSLTNANRLTSVSSAGTIGEATIAEGSITGVLTFSKTGTTARTVTFPDRALDLGEAVLGYSNLTTQYRMAYVNATGTLSESSNLVTDGSGNLFVPTTLYGSSSASGSLTLESTSNATKGDIILQPSGGNVGINNTTPGDFSGTADDLVIGDGTDTGLGVTLYGASAGSQGIYFADGITGSDRFRGFLEYNHSGDYMSLWANASEAMRIDSSGNVLLTVKGNSGTNEDVIRVEDSAGDSLLIAASDLSGNCELSIYDSTASRNIKLSGADGADNWIRNGKLFIGSTSQESSEQFLVKSSGSVNTVMSASSSTCRIYFNNTGMTASGDTQILSQNNDLAFNTGGAERVRINNTGLMVGVTSLTSGYALEVNGSVKRTLSRATAYVSSASATATITAGTPVNLLANSTIAAGNVAATEFTVDTTNRRLTYTGTATKTFDVTGTISSTASANNIVLKGFIYKNGVKVTSSEQERKIGTGADIGNWTVHEEVSLATNDYVELFVDIDTGTATITPNFCTFHAQEAG